MAQPFVLKRDKYFTYQISHMTFAVTLWRWIDITTDEGGLCWLLVSVLV